MKVHRILVKKKPSVAADAAKLKRELGIETVEITIVYDVQGLTDQQAKVFGEQFLAEPMADDLFFEKMPQNSKLQHLWIQMLPGQFDQRADSAEKVALLGLGIENVKIRCSTVISFPLDTDKAMVEKHLVNPVEATIVSGRKPEDLDRNVDVPTEVQTITGFNELNRLQLENFLQTHGLAMSIDDLLFLQAEFKHLGRDPRDIELTLVDTYWSDHCRHTTFQTHLDIKEIHDRDIERAYIGYLESRKELGRASKPITLMDMATIGMKLQHKRNSINRFVDDEIENNACTIETNVNGEKYYVLFKNETHNHPTGIEPFGGAATCLGGAIRDPLSGRAYVYQAMRVSASVDPTRPTSKTLKGRLTAYRQARVAADGYSSYGNQIGIATGHVSHIIHDGYEKPLECGFVVGAVPKLQVIKQQPVSGDIIVLLGGDTGKDGVGGATGSSVTHDSEALSRASEVQRGNAPLERQLQRLFRNPEFCRLVKKCNDFGAGGVSVAVGEIADSIDINLSAIPVKYAGLGAIERILSESQERMAIAIRREDLVRVTELAEVEGLNAAYIADVTDSNYMRCIYEGKEVVKLRREFLNSGGAVRKQEVIIKRNREAAPPKKHKSFKEMVLQTMIGIPSQQGLVEMFDATVGGRTVLNPFGGKTRKTQTQGAAMLIPADGNFTATTVSTYGFDPYLSEQTPFLGAKAAVIHALAKIVAIGGDYKDAYLSAQEYFQKQTSAEIWGETVAAMLGADEIIREFGLAAIGGKDSMSGTFSNGEVTVNVPPTYISFALCVADANTIISPEFKIPGNDVGLVRIENTVEHIKQQWDWVVGNIKAGNIISAFAVGSGGYVEAVCKMAFGNQIGFEFTDNDFQLNEKRYGDIIIEVKKGFEVSLLLGKTTSDKVIKKGADTVCLDEILEVHEAPLEKIFPLRSEV